MAQAWKYIAVLTGLLTCGSHSVWAAENAAALDFDGDVEESIAEVPIESIEQFVQIYGIVKDN